MDKDYFSERLFFANASQESFYNYLLDNFPWADKYIYYYVYVIYGLRDSIIPILESISEQDRLNYSPQLAYSYLKEYEKRRLNLAVIIPTCNRPKAIEYLLSYSAVLYRRFGIDIIIYDSSEDNKTQQIVDRLILNGYFNVRYQRYEGEYDGFSLDHKVISAYKEFGDEYTYIWLCRDGLIPIIDEFIEDMRIFSQQGIDCVIVDTKSRNKNMELRRFYSTKNDCHQFLLEQSSRLQTLGMLIISNRLFNKLIKSEPLNDTNYSLWQMAAPFHLFAKDPFPVVYLVKNVFACNMDAAPTHFWSKAEKTLEQWAKNWCNIIMNMPKEYDAVKEKCLMVYTVDFHPFTARSVLEMRGWGGMTVRMVSEYKKYIIKVTRTPILYFYIVSIIPRFMTRCIVRVAVRLPKLSGKVRRLLFS